MLLPQRGTREGPGPSPALLRQPWVLATCVTDPVGRLAKARTVLSRSAARAE